MDSTVANTGTEGKIWGGGNKPLNASYGKMMMWFFIVSDALTFSGFLGNCMDPARIADLATEIGFTAVRVCRADEAWAAAERCMMALRDRRAAQAAAQEDHAKREKRSLRTMVSSLTAMPVRGRGKPPLGQPDASPRFRGRRRGRRTERRWPRRGRRR